MLELALVWGLVLQGMLLPAVGGFIEHPRAPPALSLRPMAEGGMGMEEGKAGETRDSSGKEGK